MAKEQSTTVKNKLFPDQWIDTHGNYLFNYALGQLRNQTEAENVVQETFLAAFKSKDSFAGNSSERTWLISILRNKIIDHIRAKYKEKAVTDIKNVEQSVDDFFDQANHLKKQPSQWDLNPKNLLEQKEFWQTFHQCLRKLPKAAADAFTLKELQKLDGKTICKIMNISQSNYWILLHRSRLQLRECLERNWFEIPKPH